MQRMNTKMRKKRKLFISIVYSKLASNLRAIDKMQMEMKNVIVKWNLFVFILVWMRNTRLETMDIYCNLVDRCFRFARDSYFSFFLVSVFRRNWFLRIIFTFFSRYSCSVCFFSVGIEDAWEKKKRIPPCVNGLFSGLSSASESCACNGSNENENRRNTQKLCYKNRNNYITIAFHTEMAYDKCVFHLSVVSSDCACHCF